MVDQPQAKEQHMTLGNWLRAHALNTPIAGRRRKQRVAKRQGSARVSVEQLESRDAPAVLVVNATDANSSDNTTSDNFLTLREAVLLVNNAGNASNALGRGLSAAEASRITGTFGNFDTIRF